MTTTVTLWASTLESVEVPIITDVDPTGAAPQFGLSTSTSTPPTTYETGAWSGTWDASTKRTTARTPTLGANGTLPITASTTYVVWAKVTLGGEIAVWPVGSVKVL